MKSMDRSAVRKQKLGAERELSLKKTVIAFDVHGVLFDFHYRKLFAIIFTGAVAGAVAIRLVGLRRVWPLLFLELLFWVLLGCWYFSHGKLYGYAPAIERYFQGESIFKRMLLRNWLFFANLFVPNRGAFALAWELRNRGFKLVVASNVGKQAWTELQDANGALFVQGGRVLFDEYFHLNGRQWWSDPADGRRFAHGWLTKTHADYFRGLHAFVREQVLPTCEQIILIDNNYKLIRRAWREGEGAFRFSVFFKNSADARGALEAIGAFSLLSDPEKGGK